MKPNYTPLKKLTDKSKGARLKVRVVHKGQPTVSPSKHRYQRLLFKDEEGSTMKGTLFDNDIDTYDQALQRNGEYELCDVNIKPIPEAYRSKPDEVYQMNLGGRMKIKALDLTECCEGPQYRQLANVPTIFSANDPLIDIVAAVVFVGEMREEKFPGYTQPVRELLLADQSLSRPMKLIVKNRFAHNDAATFLTTWHENYHVVGFVGMRPNTCGGLTLTTTLSSLIIEKPTGAATAALNDWMKDNITLLDDWKAKAMLLYTGTVAKEITPLGNIINKKATAIWQDEYFWTNIRLTNLLEDDIWFYYGCNVCGKKASGEPGTTYYCYWCNAKESTVEPKLVMNTDLVDSTGTLRVTAYTSVVELFMGLTADEYITVKKQNNSPIEKKIEEIKETPFHVKISPNYELSTSNVLKWVVGAVEPPPMTTYSTDEDKNVSYEARKGQADDVNAAIHIRELETTDHTPNSSTSSKQHECFNMHVENLASTADKKPVGQEQVVPSKDTITKNVPAISAAQKTSLGECNFHPQDDADIQPNTLIHPTKRLKSNDYGRSQPNDDQPSK